LADCKISLRDDGGFELTVGTAEFGNGTSTVHRQIARPRWRHGRSNQLAAIRHRPWRPRHRRLWSAGIFVAGSATQAASENLARDLKALASHIIETDPAPAGLKMSARFAAGNACRSPNWQSRRAATAERWRQRHLRRHAASVAFTCRAFVVAVNKGTGEIRILKSVQAADAGRVANPMQCRARSKAASRSHWALRCMRKC